MKKFFQITIVLIGIVYTATSYLFLLLTVVSFKYNHLLNHEILNQERLYFQDDFLWGAGTASYQVEGGNFNSNWWRFEQLQGKIKNGDRTNICVAHYQRFKEDIDLLSELNLNSYRFSIEWSRVEPEMGKFNEQELDHYKQVLLYLKSKNVKPMVTLWHHSIPIWFEDIGSFEKAENINYYLEYVSYVVSGIGDEVEFWLTMNEPMAYITLGYISGKWPPGNQNFSKVSSLFTNIVSAHKQAYKLIHKIDEEAKVGLSEHSSYVVPAGKYNPIENITSMIIDYSCTHFLLKKVQNELDFIGVHYYYKQTIRLRHAFEVLTKKPEDFEDQSLDRAYYPLGLYEVLVRFKKYGKPLYITEIGVPDYHEIERDQFIREHVREMYYAIKSGVDVRGFYYWALLDSFEWNEGYSAKFGLIKVDMKTLERTIKDDSWEYGEIAKCNCVRND